MAGTKTRCVLCIHGWGKSRTNFKLLSLRRLPSLPSLYTMLIGLCPLRAKNMSRLKREWVPNGKTMTLTMVGGCEIKAR
jgi:hypothetical protein